MKHLLQLLVLVMFTSFSLVITGCSDKKSDPAPTTGTVNGQISPANAVTSVTATSSTTPATTTTATPSATGAYSFSNLAAGTYTLSFTPATGYVAPANQSVTVSAGGTTTATPVTAAAGSTNNRGTITVGSTTSNATLVMGNLQFNNLSVTIATATGTSVVFNLDGFNNTVGNFSLASQTSSTQLIYGETVGTTARQWTTAAFLSNNMGSGTIAVTSVGTNPRRVSGTYTATAYPASSGTTGTKTVNGTFTNVTY